MKYLAGFLTLIVAITFSLLPQIAHADSSSTSSSSDISQSISTDTSQNTSQSTVCCNGKCINSTDNNIEMHDGGCNITINNNNSGTVSPLPTVTATPEATPTATPTPTVITPSVSAEPTTTLHPIITPDPTIMQMRKDINNQVEKQVQTLKEHLKNQDQAISVFFHSGVDALQNFLNGFFK